MPDRCPYCGVPLSTVRDAYCSECRAPLTDEFEHDRQSVYPAAPQPDLSAKAGGGGPLGRFTVPARVVIVLSLFAATIGTAGYFLAIYKDLPSGSYPFWFFAIPPIAGAGLFCAAGLAFLRMGGVPIYREDAPKNSDEKEEHS